MENVSRFELTIFASLLSTVSERKFDMIYMIDMIDKKNSSPLLIL